MTYMNAQRTDWSDVMQEATAEGQPLSHQPKYHSRTRNNKSLFDLGKGSRETKSVCARKDDDVLAELVSDSIEERGIPLFLDYDRFTNPFFKFKSGVTVSAADDQLPPTFLQSPSNCEPSHQAIVLAGGGMKGEDPVGKLGSEFLDKSKTPRDIFPSESRKFS